MKTYTMCCFFLFVFIFICFSKLDELPEVAFLCMFCLLYKYLCCGLVSEAIKDGF